VIVHLLFDRHPQERRPIMDPGHVSSERYNSTVLDLGRHRVNSNERIRKRIAIIGAGPGGICAGIQLLKAGIKDFVIIEKAAGIGGTWWHNRYPGAECDVPSHLYSFSFEPKKDWSRPYARQPEILEYMRHCVTKYELTPYIRLTKEVASARWDEDSTTWDISLTDGTSVESDILISGVGMFTELNYPDIPGVDEFRGTMFHTGAWKDGHDLTGERVAVIGTAASAVQMIPEIADCVAQLSVYQRRPQWILPKEDTAFTTEQLAEFIESDIAVPSRRAKIREGLEGFITFSNREILLNAEDAGRKNLSAVKDLQTREKLTPSMAYGCRRPLASNLYYPVFNRPNVRLINSAVERISANAVHAENESTVVDTVIFATGFQTTRYLSCIDVYGRDGISIHEAWENGAQAYLGITTANFPNLFMLYGPNTNNGSILEMIELQVAYILRQLRFMDEHELRWMAPKSSKMTEYNKSLQRDLQNVDVWRADCGGYYRGRAGFIVTQWPHTMDEYKSRLESDRGSFATG
tara:strand:+ start:213 stop:1778 length:1566 start_codon:yes stop_codon:yes gene_type:complete